MPIRILDTTTASKIAAGEVVERPASVVKELAENSLDANATQITVEVEGGGLDLIRVTDNGEGIPESDLELAFTRHATSKISDVIDLESIHTMGFRGEALPSIASVSQVVLTSRINGVNQGSYIRVNAGVVERNGSVGCPEGTSVAIRDLFASVPARRKFLHSTSAELGRIHKTVTQLALAYPGTRFQFLVNGKQRFASQGTSDLRDTLASVYGSNTMAVMLGVSSSDGYGRHIWGYISPHSVSRANRSAINFYVNRRWVQSRLLLQAVEEAYRGLLMNGRHPVVALHLELPPSEIDVNVHPAKYEVRFHNTGSIFSIVQRPVREALVAHSPVPIVPSHHIGSTPLKSITLAAPFNWKQSALLGINEPQKDQPALNLLPPAMVNTLPTLRVLGQVGATYIITEGPTGIYLIDQHAAHERVMFEQVTWRAQQYQPITQGLLEPIMVELTPGQIQALESWKDTLDRYGFQGERFGGNIYLLRGVPNGLHGINHEQLLGESLNLLEQAGDPVHAGYSLAASIACHSAVRAGDTLTHEEMVGLVRQLEAADSPQTCPHGRPTILHLSSSILERHFGRK